MYFRREEIRIRKEEEKILEEILQEIKSLQKNNIPFTWTRCILETCLLGIYIHNLFLAVLMWSEQYKNKYLSTGYLHS